MFFTIPLNRASTGCPTTRRSHPPLRSGLYPLQGATPFGAPEGVRAAHTQGAPEGVPEGVRAGIFDRRAQAVVTKCAILASGWPGGPLQTAGFHLLEDSLAQQEMNR